VEERLFYLTALGAVLAQLIVFITLVFNARQARVIAERTRKWEVEDRAVLATHVTDTSSKLAEKVHMTSELLAAKVMTTSQDLATKVLETSAALEKKVEASNAAIADAIKENTLKTDASALAAREAYTEANHVNVKISDLNERLLSNERRDAEKGRK